MDKEILKEIAASRMAAEKAAKALKRICESVLTVEQAARNLYFNCRIQKKKEK